MEGRINGLRGERREGKRWRGEKKQLRKNRGEK